MEEQDPNTDLIGYEFDGTGIRWRVVGTAAVPTYVNIRAVNDVTVTSCRHAGLIRRRRQLELQAAA